MKQIDWRTFKNASAGVSRYFFWYLAASLISFFSVLFASSMMPDDERSLFLLLIITISALPLMFDFGLSESFFQPHRAELEKIGDVKLFMKKNISIVFVFMTIFALLILVFEGEGASIFGRSIDLYISFALLPFIYTFRWMLNCQKAIFLLSGRLEEYSKGFFIINAIKFPPIFLIHQFFSIEGVFLFYLLIQYSEYSYLNRKLKSGCAEAESSADIAMIRGIGITYSPFFLGVSFVALSQADKLFIFSTQSDVFTSLYLYVVFMLSGFLLVSNVINDVFKAFVSTRQDFLRTSANLIIVGFMSAIPFSAIVGLIIYWLIKSQYIFSYSDTYSDHLFLDCLPFLVVGYFMFSQCNFIMSVIIGRVRGFARVFILASLVGIYVLVGAYFSAVKDDIAHFMFLFVVSNFAFYFAGYLICFKAVMVARDYVFLFLLFPFFLVSAITLQKYLFSWV